MPFVPHIDDINNERVGSVLRGRNAPYNIRMYADRPAGHARNYAREHCGPLLLRNRHADHEDDRAGQQFHPNR